MPKPPEQPHEPAPILLSLRDLTLKIPTVVGLLAVAIVLGVPLGLTYRAGQMEAVPAPTEQRWTASSGLSVAVAAMALRGALPGPDPRQKRAPCDAEVAEEEIGGVCWIRLDVEKCNAKKAYPINGKCYWRALRPEPLPREPTSGEGRPLGVADP